MRGGRRGHDGGRRGHEGDHRGQEGAEEVRHLLEICIVPVTRMDLKSPIPCP